MVTGITCEGWNILPGNIQYVRNLEIRLPGTLKGNTWRVSFEILKRFIFYSGGTLVWGVEGCIKI